MKFDPLIEYNKRNIFVQKLCGKYGSETSSRPVIFLNMRWKLVVCSLVPICFGNSQIAIQKSKLYKTLEYWFRDMLKVAFSEKRSGTSFSITFCVWFFKKNVSHVPFYYLTKFPCLIAFTSRDIGQYVYYICLLTSLWRHKVWNWSYLFNQAVLIHNQKVQTKT